MRKLIFLVISSIAFFFCVIRPIEADLIASLAKRYPINYVDKSLLFNQAEQIDRCNTNILNTLGDSFISENNPTMAAIIYGKAMECSPANSLFRFKFGESLLLMGFVEGKKDIEDALKLEPNNPMYQSEHNRITILLQRLQ